MTERSVRILILEDDALIALDLQDIVEGCGHEVVGPCESLAAASAVLAGALDFALLDIDLPDGKSFAVATCLEERRIPFAFVSGSRLCDLPEHLRHACFVAKPYGPAAIRNTFPAGTRLAS